MSSTGSIGDVPAGTANDVCAIVENGFSKLQIWLETRLQRQEELLMQLATSNVSPKSTVRDLASESESEPTSPILSPSQNGLSKDELCILPPAPFGGVLKGSEKDPLRMTASSVNTESGDVTLPGCIGTVESPTNKPTELDLSWQQQYVDGDTRPSIQLSDNDAALLLENQDWQSKLMDVFDQLDLDRSGSIDRTEFSEAFNEVGLPPVAAFEIFGTIDQTQNGAIDRIEWLHIIEEASRSTADDQILLVQFIERLADLQTRKGKVYDDDRRIKRWCLIWHLSAFRIAWDLLMMLLLGWISMILPFSLGFGQTETFQSIDRVLDFFFCCDVILNFRTTYSDRDDSVITDGRKIACRYLKSWFLLDFVSSVPFDLITAGLLPSLTPARFLKFGKIAKVLKLLRIGKMLKVLQGSEIGDKLEEISASKAQQTTLRVSKLVMLTYVLAHWLACFGAAIDRNHIESYLAGEMPNPTAIQKYLAAIYLAITTLTTVGYGDITPTSDEERGYAMLAMVVGGAFYGFTIATLTSVISDMDRNARAYDERMDLIQAWLEKHDELPKLLRKRVRKHFKATLSTKTIIDDSAVVGDLSPELRADAAFFIIHERVRMNPMFQGIPSSAMANLLDILVKNRTQKEERIVNVGDPGIAMYFLVEGIARFDKGLPWMPPLATAKSQRFQQLSMGGSFGEEIIFGIEETYKYTVVAITDCVFHTISEDGFQDRYRNMPELQNQMYESLLRSRGVPEVHIGGGEKSDEKQAGDQKAHSKKKPRTVVSEHAKQPKKKKVVQRRGGK